MKTILDTLKAFSICLENSRRTGNTHVMLNGVINGVKPVRVMFLTTAEAERRSELFDQHGVKMLSYSSFCTKEVSDPYWAHTPIIVDNAVWQDVLNKSILEIERLNQVIIDMNKPVTLEIGISS